jgi:heme-degrading monooxygenase HmoA
VARYTYVWEFHVDASRRAEFERCYGPAGPWAQLFARADGYVETVLLHDDSNPPRYVTIDRWASVEAHRAFRDRFAAEYAALDRECEDLTSRETLLGEFSEV